MTTNRRTRGFSFAALALGLVLVTCVTARGQDETPAPDLAAPPAASRANAPRTNFEVQLHMLAASNGETQKGSIAPALEPIAKQLKDSSPFAMRRVVMTLVCRVSDGGTLDSRGIMPLVISSGPVSGRVRSGTTYTLRLGHVRWESGAAEKGVIAFDLNYMHRIPVVAVEDGREVFSNEDAALSTRTSVLEGVPTVIGTLTSSRPDEVYLLAVTIKRARLTPSTKGRREPPFARKKSDARAER